MVALPLHLPVDQEQGWGDEYRLDLTAIRDLLVYCANALGGIYTIRWVTGVGWPTKPSDLAAGTIVLWWSFHDSSATMPTDATTDYVWFRRVP